MAQDAISLIKSDHDKIRSLLEKLSKTTERAEKTRTDLVKEIEKEVTAHVAIEEEIFYPRFRDANGKEHQKMYHEAVEEHRAVGDLVLPDLKKTDPQTPEFAGRCKVLKELLEHHLSEEEEDMLPKAREVLSEDELLQLGKEMAARKKELMAQA